VSAQQVVVHLPPAEIFNIDQVVNDKRTYVYQRDGLPFLADKDLETKARARASDEIIWAACEAGILQSATDNAIVAVERLLTPIGLPVKVVPAPAGQCPVQVTPPPIP
jgi:hypothetical protein